MVKKRRSTTREGRRRKHSLETPTSACETTNTPTVEERRNDPAIRNFSEKRIKIFLHGSFKRGFYNNNAYLSCASARGQANFLFDSKTSTDSCLAMVVHPKTKHAIMYSLSSLNEASERLGDQIHGEVWQCDAMTLAALDEFHDNFFLTDDAYQHVKHSRQTIVVENALNEHEMVEAWFVDDIAKDYSFSQFLSPLPLRLEYTASDHRAFEPRGFQPKILELISGVSSTYFDLFWDRERAGTFENVWRQSLGEPLLTSSCNIKQSDFYLSKVPNQKWSVLLFKTIGYGFYLVTPFSFLLTIFNVLLCFVFSPSYEEMHGLVERFSATVSNVIVSGWFGYGNHQYTVAIEGLYFGLSVWCFVEVGFCLFMKACVWKYENRARSGFYNVPQAEEERKENFRQLCSTEFRSRPRGRKYFVDWFLRAKTWEDIHEGNLQDFYCAVFLEEKNYSELPDDLKREIDHYAHETQRLIGGVPQGRNAAITCIRIFSDPLLAEHHPIIFYFFTEILVQEIYSFFVLRLSGFKPAFAGPVRYWYYPGPEGGKKNRTPIALFPGLGVGLLSYQLLFASFMKDRAVILFEVPCISLRVLSGFLHYSREDIAFAVRTVQRRHGFDGFHFVCHSYGNAFGSFIIKAAGETIKGITLIDPISFVIHKADICKNVLYDPFEDGRIYLLNREPHVAFTLQRTTKWHNVIIWPKDLANLKNCTPNIVLSGSDSIIPCNSIKSTLAEAGSAGVANSIVMWLPDVDHAEFLFEKAVRERVVELVLSGESEKNSVRGMKYILVNREKMRPRLIKKRRKRKALGLMKKSKD